MEDPQSKILELPFPIPRTHCGIALGNGNFGALVWGHDRLHITVNRADFWDHRNGQLVPEGATYERMKAALGTPLEEDGFCWILNDRANPPPRQKSSRLPFGRFELAFADGLTPHSARLDMRRGCARIALRNAAGRCETLDLAMVMDANVLVLHDPDQAIESVHCRTALEWVATEWERRRLARPEPVRAEGLDGWIQALPEDPSMAAVCRRNPTGLCIALERGADNPAAQAAALNAMAPIETGGPAAAFESTARWWEAFWRDVPEVRLPSSFLNRFLDYALFKFGAATTPQSPIPAGLQGPWGEEYQAIPWNGDYHFNVNVQQIYTLALAANRTDHLLPLFDMLESSPFHEAMHVNAQRLFGIEDGLVLTHAVDDRGRQVGGLSAGSVLDLACGGWTAQLYWLYYRHTGDAGFLRRRAYPFMRGIMRGFEGLLEKQHGRYRIPVSISAEYRYTDDRGRLIHYGPDPSYQLACIHMLLEALFAAGAILDIEPPCAWRDIKAHLPHYTLIDGDEGPQIAVWEGQGLDACHRHHSHLACIYPFDSLGEPTPEQEAVLRNSIDHWIAMGMGTWSEWCYPWAVILQARMGFTESPRILLNIWKDLFVNEGLTTAYLPRFQGLTLHRRADMLKPRETHEVMQLDGTMGGATAIYEMLAHCRNGVIHVFPGISAQWRDVSFHNIGLPGAARISAARREGHVSCVTLHSLHGGAYRLQITGLDRALCLQGGQRRTVDLPVSLELRPEERVELKPADGEC